MHAQLVSVSRRSMLRHAAAVLAIGLTGGLTACSGSTAPTSHRVAFVVANSQLNFASEMMSGFRTGVQDVGGVDEVVEGPPIVDGPRQLQMFQDLTKSARDGISVFTLTPDLFAGPLADAVRAGVPLIAVDNQPPLASNVSLFVGNDNYQLGQMLADEVAAELPPDASGTIVLGNNSPGVPVLDRRAKGIRDEFHQRLPRATVIGPFDTKQEVSANLAAWQTLVQANPTALAFVGTGDADGWNLASIRVRTHATWAAGAFDLDPRAMQAVKDGSLVLVSPEHFIKGAVAGRLQAERAKGKALPRGWFYTPGLAVNRTNIDAIMARQASLSAKRAYFEPLIQRILSDPSYLRPLAQIS